MPWRYTDWWGALLSGLVGPVLGGVLAAGVALLVVRMTSRRQREDALAAETRQALLVLLMHAEQVKEAVAQNAHADVSVLVQELSRELARCRALLADGPADLDGEELRAMTYAFIAGVQARQSGEPPATVIGPHAKLRELLKGSVSAVNAAR